METSLSMGQGLLKYGGLIKAGLPPAVPYGTHPGLEATDMLCLEDEISHLQKDPNDLKRKSSKISDYYYESLRTNVFNIFGSQSYADSYLGSKHPLRPVAEEGEKYDNYLTKLQNICTENVGEESKPVYESVKSSITPAMSVLPTPT